MPRMEWWEWVLWCAAGYAALTSIVGLMRRRRDRIVDELRHHAELERQRQAEARLNEERRKRAEKASR